jgi:23S rRNA (adenine1618-N6)-methyltransferase
MHWDIPAGYLCPPIPGRADYVHFVADILAEGNGGLVPKGKQIKCLDIGTGANCIYPIIGSQEYGWSFVGTDIDLVSVKSANAIVAFNETLKNQIELRLQSSKDCFFEGAIKKGERFDITLCNPPFYGSAEEAERSNNLKNQNLSGKRTNSGVRNFGGTSNELWCEGGEIKFILTMIRESVSFSENCRWFTTLVSKREHLERIYKEFDKLKIKHTKTIEMSQGQKVSRFVAWRF